MLRLRWRRGHTGVKVWSVISSPSSLLPPDTDAVALFSEFTRKRKDVRTICRPLRDKACPIACVKFESWWEHEICCKGLPYGAIFQHLFISLEFPIYTTGIYTTFNIDDSISHVPVVVPIAEQNSICSGKYRVLVPIHSNTPIWSTSTIWCVSPCTS